MKAKIYELMDAGEILPSDGRTLFLRDRAQINRSALRVGGRKE